MTMLGDLPLPWPVEINLSKPAMEFLIAMINEGCEAAGFDTVWTPSVECELDNFRNMLQNLIERSEPLDIPAPMSGEAAAIYEPETQPNFDLIGD